MKHTTNRPGWQFPALALSTTWAGGLHAQGFGPGGGGGGGGGGASVSAGGDVEVVLASAVVAAALVALVRATPGRAASGRAASGRAASGWAASGWAASGWAASGGLAALLAGACGVVFFGVPFWLAASLVVVVLAAARRTAATFSPVSTGAPASWRAVVGVVGAVAACAFVDDQVAGEVLAASAAAVLDGLGVPTASSGTAIDAGEGFVLVESSCLGREGTAVSLALSASLWLLLGAGSRRVVGAAAAHAIAFQLANFVRITAVAFAMHHGQDIAEATHVWGALVPLVVHALFVVPPLLLLNRRRQPDETPRGISRFIGPVPAFLALVVAVVVAG
jgi:exosortase/archaeosortase family protein